MLEEEASLLKQATYNFTIGGKKTVDTQFSTLDWNFFFLPFFQGVAAVKNVGWKGKCTSFPFLFSSSLRGTQRE